MKRLLTVAIAAAAALCGFTPLQAEDIDLFVQPPGEAVGPPNVLIVLDNTANWNDPFTAEMQALSETFESLEVNGDGTAKFRVGLMLFTESGGANKGEDGGYVRAAVRDLDAGQPGRCTRIWSTASTGSATSRTAARPARPWPTPTSTSPACRR